jgi:hypothetical protein
MDQVNLDNLETDAHDVEPETVVAWHGEGPCHVEGGEQMDVESVSGDPYRSHRFPKQIISHCAWLYLRFGGELPRCGRADGRAWRSG